MGVGSTRLADQKAVIRRAANAAGLDMAAWIRPIILDAAMREPTPKKTLAVFGRLRYNGPHGPAVTVLTRMGTTSSHASFRCDSASAESRMNATG